MRRLRRVAVGVLTVLVVAGFLVAVTESPASARKVGNPGGGFTLKVQAGNLAIGANSFSFVDEGRQPQCSDGTNNDGAQDTAIDSADPECTSATDDSETAGGFQPKLPIQMTNGTVSANGSFTFPAANVSFPDQYLYVDAPSPVNPFVVTIHITANVPVTGIVNPLTGAVTMDMNVRVGATGGPLASGCQINPVVINGATTGTMPPIGDNPAMTGLPYDVNTGRMTLIHNAYSVPGASNCGTYTFVVNLNDQINSQLGLPSPAGKNTASFETEWIPRPTLGVTSTFTTTPSSGIAPLNVSFNATGSTGTAPLTYQWDFTNNGSFDATGLTTSFTYPAAGVQTARLRVTDGDGDVSETTRAINVGANLPPTANDQTVSTPEDMAKSITLTASDPEGGTLTFTRVVPDPTHGSVTCAGTACTYTPNANFNGTDSFGFRATDNLPNSDDGVITINVTPVNDAPTASNVSATLLEDGSTPVNLVASDIESDPLTYTVVTPPTKGMLSGSGASLTYSANPDQNGPDSFTYKVNDGSLDSNVATASITITAVNDPPVADPQSVSTPEDTATAVTLTGHDVDGTFVYGIVSPPSHGSLSGTLPNLTYTPAANYNGSDSFVFKVTDNLAAVGTAQIDITVTPVNDAPTTSDATVGTTEDTPVDVTVVANDIDGDTLTYTPSTAAHGTVSCADEVCTYTPASGYSGGDSFTVDVSDGTATVTSTVTISVSALNNAAPVINDSDVVVLEDTARSFTLASADADGDPRTLVVLVTPATGSLSCTTAGVCSYTPALDANGDVTFVVRVSDGRGGIDNATITLSIVPINDAPAVPAQSVGTAEDTPVPFSLSGSDVDGDPVTWAVKQAPSKGSLTCDGAGACTYTPHPNANGSDSFEVEAADGQGGRVRINVPVTINPVNDPPTAGVVTKSVPEDGSASFSLVGSDAADGGSVAFAAAPATLGTLSCATGGACTFVAAANANGTETIAYTVDDGSGPVTGAIVLTIVAANDTPIAVSQTLSTPEDTPVAVTLAANDPDVGDGLTFQVTTAPGTGHLSGPAPNLTYTPGANASGTVSFGFSVRDTAGAQTTGTITLVVTPVNDAPIANSGAVTTPEDTAIGIALTGSDVEGPVTAAVTALPTHGTYSSGVYTPALNYNGPDLLGFKVTDNQGLVTNGQIAITVTPVNDPPDASDLHITTTKTVAVPAPLFATDPDGAATLTYAIVTPPTKGTLSGTAPNLTYTPTGFNTGNDAFTWKVTDSAGVTDSATVTITINTGPILATQLAVGPATVVRPTGLNALLGQNSYTNLNATLTTVGSNLPISGQTIKFTVSGKQICTATTNASGFASCSGKGAKDAATTYQGTYAGNFSYGGSTGTGALS